jgi:hypothetical protein
MRKALVALLASAGLVGGLVALGATAEATPPIPTQLVSNTVDITESVVTVPVDCPSGTKVTGGGFNAIQLDGSNSGSGLLGSYPESNGWRVVWFHNNYSVRLTVWAVCVG